MCAHLEVGFFFLVRRYIYEFWQKLRTEVLDSTVHSLIVGFLKPFPSFASSPVDPSLSEMNTRRSKRSRELDATASPVKNEAAPSAKRIASGPSTSAPADDIEDKVSLSIVIKWSSMSDVDGRTKVKVNRLSLKELENVDKLGE
jgi:hypothetical protein